MMGTQSMQPPPSTETPKVEEAQTRGTQTLEPLPTSTAQLKPELELATPTEAEAHLSFAPKSIEGQLSLGWEDNNVAKGNGISNSPDQANAEPKPASNNISQRPPDTPKPTPGETSTTSLSEVPTNNDKSPKPRPDPKDFQAAMATSDSSKHYQNITRTPKLIRAIAEPLPNNGSPRNNAPSTAQKPKYIMTTHDDGTRKFLSGGLLGPQIRALPVAIEAKASHGQHNLVRGDTMTGYPLTEESSRQKVNNLESRGSSSCYQS